MRGLKTLLGGTLLVAALALAPKAQAQIVINLGVQPACEYGYYDYEPYACAPYGFYGPGYFYNGIFLGMGPWSGWGYNHGWGSHRFSEAGGGNYRGGRGPAYRPSNGGNRAIHNGAVPQRGAGGEVHGNSPALRPSPGRPAQNNSAPRAAAPRAASPRGGGSARPNGGGNVRPNGGGGHPRADEHK